MPDQIPTRRDFLQRSAGGAAGLWATLLLSGCRDAARSSAEAVAQGDETPRILTAEEMKILDGLSDRIIPADGDSPGASGARAVVFMDHYAAAQPSVLQGLRGLLSALPDGVATMDAAGRDDVVRGLEKDHPDMLGLLSFLTLVGTIGVPARGGNHNGLGYEMIGFDPRHAWQPPFGYYDAQAMKAAKEGDA